MGKPDDITLLKRVEQVYDLVMQGYTSVDVLRYVADQTDWGCSERTVYNYIAKAKERYIENSKYVREEELGKSMSRLGLLFSRSLQIQDYKTALSIQKEINEVCGLKTNNAKIEVNLPPINIIAPSGPRE